MEKVGWISMMKVERFTVRVCCCPEKGEEVRGIGWEKGRRAEFKRVRAEEAGEENKCWGGEVIDGRRIEGQVDNSRKDGMHSHTKPFSLFYHPGDTQDGFGNPPCGGEIEHPPTVLVHEDRSSDTP